MTLLSNIGARDWWGNGSLSHYTLARFGVKFFQVLKFCTFHILKHRLPAFQTMCQTVSRGLYFRPCFTTSSALDFARVGASKRSSRRPREARPAGGLLGGYNPRKNRRLEAQSLARKYRAFRVCFRIISDLVSELFQTIVFQTAFQRSETGSVSWDAGVNPE